MNSKLMLTEDMISQNASEHDNLTAIENCCPNLY